jgi:hypothetical protein
MSVTSVDKPFFTLRLRALVPVDWRPRMGGHGWPRLSSAIRDTDGCNQKSKRHPVLDVNAEDSESLDQHMQGRFPRCGATGKRYYFYMFQSTAKNTAGGTNPYHQPDG